MFLDLANRFDKSGFPTTTTVTFCIPPESDLNHPLFRGVCSIGQHSALTRGFMYSGGKRVVASLWKVDDSATAALMAQFYKEMFINKRPPAEALKEAQIYISNQRRWRSPYYWAGFVMQGEWK